MHEMCYKTFGMNTKIDTAQTKKLQKKIAARQREIIARIQELVEIESPSGDAAAINRAVDTVTDWCMAQGAEVKRHARPKVGDILEAWFGPKPKRALRPVMILGHLDTVWPMGTLRQMPFREDAQRIYGPGVLDMKTGVVMALEAIAAQPLTRPVVLLLTSDEEVGSRASRALIEKIAARCAAVYVLEPAQGLAYKTSRKGVGEYQVTVTGVASHSGVDFEKGHSAVLELAKLIQKTAGFCDLKRGITVNAGVVRGGTRSNVIAAEASAEIDVRITRMAQAAMLDKKFRALRTEDKHCSIKLGGGVNRPPMERTPGTVALFRRAQKFAASMGLKLDEASTGGGSDGNFTAGIGVATLDGMGAVGIGAHAQHEQVEKKHLPQRIALIAAMLQE